MTTHICKRPDCDRQSRARGLCPKHYLQWNRVGAKKRAAEGTSRPKSYRSLVFAALPGAIIDIMAKTDICQRTVQMWVRTFRTEKVARVIRWRRPAVSGDFVPIYGAGSGPDAECKLKPYYANSQSAWKRRKSIATDEQRDIMRRRARTYKQLRAAAKRRDPLVAALFGVRASVNGEG
ncbi:MAG: hypothetical protein JWQ01_4852 [Massilia sp.]|nr:hypothetical protein [Massilia sp.]